MLHADQHQGAEAFEDDATPLVQFAAFSVGAPEPVEFPLSPEALSMFMASRDMHNDAVHKLRQTRKDSRR